MQKSQTMYWRCPYHELKLLFALSLCSPLFLVNFKYRFSQMHSARCRVRITHEMRTKPEAAMLVHTGQRTPVHGFRVIWPDQNRWFHLFLTSAKTLTLADLQLWSGILTRKLRWSHQPLTTFVNLYLCLNPLWEIHMPGITRLKDMPKLFHGQL